MLKFLIALAKRKKEFIKFLISGGLATLVDFVFLYLFHGVMHVSVSLAAALAFLLAFFVSFYLQKFWTFRDNRRDKMTQQMFSFFVLGLCGLAVNAIGMHILVEIFSVWYMLSQALIVGSLAAVNFLVYKFVIFKKEHKHLKKKILFSENGVHKTRLLIATGIYPPDSGGPATYSRALKNELPKHNYRVKVLTYGEGRSETEKDVYVINRNKFILFRYLDYFYSAWKLAVWADIVYAQGPVSEGLPAWLASKLRRKKFILKVVGDYAWEQGFQRFGVTDLLDEFQDKKYSWQVELMRKIEKLVARQALLVITPSEYLKKVVIRWGIDAEKIKAIYNSINFREVEPQPKKQNEKCLVTIARLTPWKGIDALIEIMPDLWQTEANLHLIIIGDGPEKENLEKIKSALPLDQQAKVHLLGNLKNSETIAYLRSADIFILNSGYEGLSHVILEALNCGVPVLASRVGGNPEVVISGKTGELFEYNNAVEIKDLILKTLAKDKKEKIWLTSPEGEVFMRQFHFSVMIHRINKIIERVRAF